MSAGGVHGADASARGIRGGWRLFGGTFLTVLLLAVGSSAGALWTTGAVPLGATASVATAAATSTGATALTRTYQFTPANAATQNIRIAPIVYTNTGTAPLALSATMSNNTAPLAANVSLTYWAGSGGGCAASIPATGVSVGTLAAPPALPAALSAVPVGGAVTLCTATSLSTTMLVSQGLSVSPTLTLTGRVGANWIAAVPLAFTQSVYRVPDPTGLTCAQTGALNNIATLSFTAAPGASSYRVVRATSGTLIKTATTSPITITASDLGLVGLLTIGTLPVLVQATDATGTVSPGLPATVTVLTVIATGCG